MCKQAPFAVGVNAVVRCWPGPCMAWLRRDRVSGVKGPRAGRYVGAGVMANRRAVEKAGAFARRATRKRESIEGLAGAGRRSCRMTRAGRRRTHFQLAGWRGSVLECKSGRGPARQKAPIADADQREPPVTGPPLGNSGVQGSVRVLSGPGDANHAPSRFVSGSVKPLGLVFLFPKRRQQQSTRPHSLVLARIQWRQLNRLGQTTASRARGDLATGQPETPVLRDDGPLNASDRDCGLLGSRSSALFTHILIERESFRHTAPSCRRSKMPVKNESEPRVMTARDPVNLKCFALRSTAA